MDQDTTQSEATGAPAVQRTRNDPHPEYGVINAPTEEDIAMLAYRMYLMKGRQQGQCRQNWQQAEYDLRTAPPTHPMSG